MKISGEGVGRTSIENSSFSIREKWGEGEKVGVLPGLENGKGRTETSSGRQGILMMGRGFSIQ